MIDASLVERFDMDGAVVVPGLLAPEWIESLRHAIPEILGHSYDPGTRLGDGVITADERHPIQQTDGMWRSCEGYARFLFRSPIGETAAQFMRSGTARLFEDLLLYKPAGAPSETSWHRDAPHWPLKGRQLCSIWFSLESTTSETGAMRFVLGSHRDSDELVNARAITVAQADLEDRAVAIIEAEPGDAIVFHPRALHTAYGSAPDSPRRTFTLRFMGDDVRWRPRSSVFHPWMAECGLSKGDIPRHPWFPVVAQSPREAVWGVSSLK